MELRRIAINKIVEDPDQPRKVFDETGLAGLADSLRQHGVLNPITVVPLAGVDAYRIITGERRWRASQLAGLDEVPCLVRPADAIDRRSEQLIENLQREDLAPVDKANAIKILKQEIQGTNKEVAQRLGLSDRMVGHLLDLQLHLAPLRELVLHLLLELLDLRLLARLLLLLVQPLLLRAVAFRVILLQELVEADERLL